MYGIANLTAKELRSLRREIALNSLYLGDYSNSLGIDEKEAFDFFEGYVGYLLELAGKDGIKCDNALDLFEVFDLYDNPRNLSAWQGIIACSLGD